ncbi:acetyl-CoA carboxylase biotin carboxyl carrier protein [Saccharomonospora amisosensis]|uniref:Biotin carboxyl carrier protein of acetyl-CoA carboxylase n=1 Tax=Saccharomonospora amisosensis TaxID=1128677 RepID=A0A7X5UPP0_9PSEU|nr:biotin/lipoyl-containing protein [Saccharomonospora amisosensis]NIJ11901.1 acetyl-CoA carboxylase biotin carboxyl carrier protein [Saccharomonospora amisosensis]
MTTNPEPAERLLFALRDNVVALATQTPHPPSWIRVAVGDTALELSWDGVPNPVQVPEHAAPPETEAAAQEEPDEQGEGTQHIEAPTVGVFYRAPEPGATPFVSVGDTVTAGQQVGIVEAMKLMIPVLADRAGRVTEILVPDATPVEYGEPLLAWVPVGAG